MAIPSGLAPRRIGEIHKYRNTSLKRSHQITAQQGMGCLWKAVTGSLIQVSMHR
jgi:hypothetical protein